MALAGDAFRLPAREGLRARPPTVRSPQGGASMKPAGFSKLGRTGYSPPEVAPKLP